MKYNPKKIVPLKLSGQAVKFVDIPLKPKTQTVLLVPIGILKDFDLIFGPFESHNPDQQSLSE